MEIVFVADFGSALAQDVAKQVRISGVYSEIVKGSELNKALQAQKPHGVILVGAEEMPLELETQVPIWHLQGKSFCQAELEEQLKKWGLQRQWNLKDFLDHTVQAVWEQVGSEKIICGLSGGIDSAVAAALVHRAVGNQLICIYVDHGFMRAGESEQVVQTFQKDLGIPLVHVQAQDRFITKLAGIEDPEQKRKIIGTEFIRVFEEEAAKIGDANFLVQGTLYTDVLESGSEEGQLVKSHHNVGGLPEDLDFELVEPLATLFKDEVRLLAKELGLPDEIVWRHPFPGPGLAIRIIGEVTREKLNILRQADAIAMEEIQKAGLYREIWQALVVLTNTRTVGVYQGQRSYDYVAALRFVNSSDGLTAEWSRVPHAVLAQISERIMEEVRGINRVVYDISPKPPATIEWE